MTAIRITRAGPAATVQDAGRFGALQHGISASGPMDRGAFEGVGALLPTAGEAIEFTRAGFDFVLGDAAARAACGGGAFTLRRNSTPLPWGQAFDLSAGDRIEITPGAWGNYGYLRFDRTIGVPPVLGSRATNLVAGLGGLSGRALRAGDRLELGPPLAVEATAKTEVSTDPPPDAPLRFIWGIHADLFAPAVRQAFVGATFTVSTRLDRMGVRLEDPERVFAGEPILSLVSDAIVPGDVQILGDGTPIVLMRDHQPTGGYPRIATVISADLDRFAQMRPGTALAFAPVNLQKARALSLASHVR